ncbi:MAG: tetratricopeptide repeat protein [Cyanobacteria bacterium J06638_22]
MKKTHHWLDIAEYATLVGLGVGSITSFVSAQFFYTSAPLSLLVLLNLASRNRLEQEMQRRTQQAIAQIDHKVSQNLDRLNQQIQTLPTTEAMGGLRKSMLVKNREMAERLAGEIKTLQDGVQAVLVMIERLKLGTVRQDLDAVRQQYDSLNNGVIGLTNQVQQMVNSGQFDQMEQAIAQLRQNTKQLEANIQSLADQTKPTLTALQDQISHLNRQFQKLPPPFDSSALRQEVAELTRMVADLVPKRDLSALSRELSKLQSQQESQLAAEEAFRRKLQDISLQLQSRPTKSSLTSLQNQINHLNRQVQKLPPPFDATALEQEVAKVVKVMSSMVPRRDFSSLITQVKSLQQQQEFQLKIERTLQKELQALSQQLQAVMENPPVATAGTTAAEPDPTPQAFQDRLEAVLHQPLTQVREQLRILPPDAALDESTAIALLQALATINAPLQNTPDGSQYEFVLDVKASEPSADSTAEPIAEPATEPDAEPPAQTHSRRILEEALERSQEQLVIILPWSRQVNLDDQLLEKMETFLRQQRHLHVGWCHQTQRTQGRFLKAIQQRWQVQPELQSTLQETLQRLLQLKRIDPQRCQFQIMGTRENFLVSDQQYAVLGMDEALATASRPDVELKLRTTDPVVVQQLSERFGQPTPESTDIAAHWNLMATRYDLGDRQSALESCNQILSITPNDANAFNFRGILHYEMGDRTAALAAFDQAIKCDPQNIVPYCNRGYVRSEHGDQLGAIADYSAALRADAESSLPYFLRGMSCQKFGEIEGALADYDEVLRRIPDSPVVFYYRGLTRAKIGEFGGAIGDLEQALEGFTQQRNETNARKVFSYLEQLRQAHPNAIVPPPNTPAVSQPAPETLDLAPSEPVDTATASLPNDASSASSDTSGDAGEANSPTDQAPEPSDRPSRFYLDEGLEVSEFMLLEPTDAPSDRPAMDAELEPLPESDTLASETPAANGIYPSPSPVSEPLLQDEASSATDSELTTPTDTVNVQSDTAAASDTVDPINTDNTHQAEYVPVMAEDAETDSALPLEVLAATGTESEGLAAMEPRTTASTPATASADDVILLPPPPEAAPASTPAPSAALRENPDNERLADFEDPFIETAIAAEDTAEEELDLTAVNQEMDGASAPTPDAAEATEPLAGSDEDITLIQDDDVPAVSTTAPAGPTALASAPIIPDNIHSASDADTLEPSEASEELAATSEEVTNPFQLPEDQALLFAPTVREAYINQPGDASQEEDTLTLEHRPSDVEADNELTASSPEAAPSAKTEDIEEDVIIALGPVVETPGYEPGNDTSDDSASNVASPSQPPSFAESSFAPAATAEPETTAGTLFEFFDESEDEVPGQPEASLQASEELTAAPPNSTEPEISSDDGGDSSPDSAGDVAIAPSTEPPLEPSTSGDTLSDFFDLGEEELVDNHPEAERLASQEEAQDASSTVTASNLSANDEPMTTTESLFSFFSEEDEPDVSTPSAVSMASTQASSDQAEASFPVVPVTNPYINDSDASANPFSRPDEEHSGTREVQQPSPWARPPMPSSNGGGMSLAQQNADLADLTLARFLDDLNQAWEGNAATPGAEQVTITDGATATNASSGENGAEPLDEAPRPNADAESFSDFCSQF